MNVRLKCWNLVSGPTWGQPAMAPQQPLSWIRLTETKTSAAASGQASPGLLRPMSRQVTTFWGLLTLFAIAASSVHAETRQEGSPTEPDAAAVVASRDHESVASAQATLASEHWVWQPVQQFDVPSVSKSAWAQDSIDAFILARLDAEGLTPAEEVDALIWLRRVTFHLTGLPPTPRAIENFLADNSPAGRAKVVSRLLESPAFGECWAQH